jgi:hypothetical protein
MRDYLGLAMALFLVVLIMLSTGCSTTKTHVSVLKSPAEIKEYEFKLKDRAVLICDEKKCRELGD